jgi:hypothetical protein
MKPNLDYYIGRKVEAITQGDEGDWDWTLRLEGDILISNHDKRRTSPPTNEIIGLVFLMAVLQEDLTVMKFGNYEASEDGPVPAYLQDVQVTPTQYAVADERFEGGPHFPQRLDEEEQEMLPDDPSPERVVDGPSDEHLTAQENARREAEEATESHAEGQDEQDR